MAQIRGRFQFFLLTYLTLVTSSLVADDKKVPVPVHGEDKTKQLELEGRVRQLKDEATGLRGKAKAAARPLETEAAVNEMKAKEIERELDELNSKLQTRELICVSGTYLPKEAKIAFGTYIPLELRTTLGFPPDSETIGAHDFCKALRETPVGKLTSKDLMKLEGVFDQTLGKEPWNDAWEQERRETLRKAEKLREYIAQAGRALNEMYGRVRGPHEGKQLDLSGAEWARGVQNFL